MLKVDKTKNRKRAHEKVKKRTRKCEKAKVKRSKSRKSKCPLWASIQTHFALWRIFVMNHALYPLGPVATLRFCHLRPRCVSKQRCTTNVIISDRVWWIWCDAGLATVATRPQRSPHSVASNSRPDYFAATRSRSLLLRDLSPIFQGNFKTEYL